MILLSPQVGQLWEEAAVPPDVREGSAFPARDHSTYLAWLGLAKFPDERSPFEIVSMIRLRHAFTRRGRLLVAPYAALAADAAVTLLLQSSDYWSGRYEAASEAEVIGATTLRLHPLAFVAWIAVWASALGVVIALVPLIIARITCVAAALLHTFALLTWLWAWSSNPYTTYACGLVSAALIVYSLEQKTRADTEAGASTSKADPERAPPADRSG